jgi:hypothetical protein
MAVEVTAEERMVPPGASVKALFVGQPPLVGSTVVTPNVDVAPE